MDRRPARSLPRQVRRWRIGILRGRTPVPGLSPLRRARRRDHSLAYAGGLRSANGDGYFGLGGVSIETARAGQSIYLDAECERLEIHYLLQPGGGALGCTTTTSGSTKSQPTVRWAPGLSRYDTSPGPHRFKLLTVSSKPVRLFGWVADKPTGVTYEALGINGAEASVMLKWNDEMTATYLQARNPGLIVLAYGTNEASDPSWNLESYRAMLGELLQRLRRRCSGGFHFAAGSR